MSNDRQTPPDPKIIDLERERQFRFWRDFMRSSKGQAMRTAAERVFGKPTPPKENPDDDQG